MAEVVLVKNYEFLMIPDRSILKEIISGVWDANVLYRYEQDMKIAAAPIVSRQWVLLSNLNHWQISEPDLMQIALRSLTWACLNKLAYNAIVLSSGLHRILLHTALREGSYLDKTVLFDCEIAAMRWLSSKGF